MPPKRRPGSSSNRSTQSLKSVFDETLDKKTDDKNIKELIRHLNKRFLDETKGESQSTARSRASRVTGTNKQAFSVEQLYSVVTHLKDKGVTDEDIRNIKLEDFVQTNLEILMSKAGAGINKKYRNKTKRNKEMRRNKKTRRNKKKRRNNKTKKIN